MPEPVEIASAGTEPRVLTNAGVVERERLIWHGITNYSGFLIAALCTVVLVPVMIHGLGRQAYGLWIAMESAAAMLARIDLGLTWTVTREVAADPSSTNETIPGVVSAAAGVYLIIGMVGWLCMAAVGGPAGRLMGASPVTSAALFAIGGAVFMLDIMRAFALSILRGLRRFDLANSVISLSAIVWTAGAISLLLSGHSLIPVVAWQALASLVITAIAFLLVKRVSPRILIPRGLMRFGLLRGHLAFSITSQLAAVVNAAFWEVPAFVIGVLLGAPQIVSYYVGRVFPSAASAVAWRGAEVLYPAASEYERTGDRESTRSVLDLGMRWSAITMLPISVVLWVTAPALIRSWVGGASGAEVTILRCLLVVEMLDAVGVGPATVLWGGGAATLVLAIGSAMLVASVGLCFALVSIIGVTGAAVALLLPVCGGAAACVIIGARRCDLGAVEVLLAAGQGLAFPLAACVAATFLMNAMVSQASWSGVVATWLAGGVAYIATFRLYGTRPEEARVIAAAESYAVRLARSFSRS
jgi:O-antigen/teichoic acid export membrane protein